MNIKNKNIAILILLFLSLTSLGAKEPSQKPIIAASTFSLYDMAKNIASDTAEVFMILPFGVDAHSYEPTPKDMIKISKSTLVLYNGAGLEPWIDGFDFKNRAINISLHVKLREVGAGEHSCSDKDAHHNHGSVDPHYWLDPQNMILAAEKIAGELIAMFPKNRDKYIYMLKNLDKTYREALSACKLDTIIVNHNAFSYLSHRYGFNVEALSGLSPEAEPSGKNMIKLIEHVREHKVGVVFFESFVSDKAIKSIAKETNAGVDVLQPLANITADEAKQQLGYEEIMKINLQKISKVLMCR